MTSTSNRKASISASDKSEHDVEAAVASPTTEAPEVSSLSRFKFLASHNQSTKTDENFFHILPKLSTESILNQKVCSKT